MACFGFVSSPLSDEDSSSDVLHEDEVDELDEDEVELDDDDELEPDSDEELEPDDDSESSSSDDESLSAAVLTACCFGSFDLLVLLLPLLLVEVETKIWFGDLELAG